VGGALHKIFPKPTYKIIKMKNEELCTLPNENVHSIIWVFEGSNDRKDTITKFPMS
jgi:hypothetical protein